MTKEKDSKGLHSVPPEGRFAADPESKVVKAELVEPDPRSTTQFYPYWQVTARVEVPHKGDYAVTVSPANPQDQTSYVERNE